MENNKLIAEFYLENIPHEHTFGIALLHMESEAMEFHTSWDWLMPVVQKCFDTQQPEEGQHYFINESLLTMDIEVVYDRVVEFIKIYNTTQWKKDWDNTMKTYTS